jgi:hypothetical protein
MHLVATPREELLKLIEDLAEAERAELAQSLRRRHSVRGSGTWADPRPLTTLPADDLPAGDSTVETEVEDAVGPDPSYSPVSNEDPAALPWPSFGPITFGAAILIGGVAGAVGGPVVAALGAVAGLLVGSVLDRVTAPVEH